MSVSRSDFQLTQRHELDDDALLLAFDPSASNDDVFVISKSDAFIDLLVAPLGSNYGIDVSGYINSTNTAAQNAAGVVSLLAAYPDGGTFKLPIGTCAIEKSASGFYCIPVRSGDHWVGQGQGVSTLKVADGAVAFVRMFGPTGDAVFGWSSRAFTVDCNKANRTTSEHNHAIMFANTSVALVQDMELINSTGDGVLVYDNCRHIKVDGNEIHANERNGVTLGGETNWTEFIKVTNNSIYDNLVQGVDIEPDGTAGVRHLSIEGNTIVQRGTLGSDQWCIALSSSTAKPSTGVVVKGNRLVNGAIISTFTAQAKIVDNDIRIAAGLGAVWSAPEAAILGLYSNDDLEIKNNYISYLGTVADNLSSGGVFIAASGGYRPGRVVVEGNTIDTPNTLPIGVQGAEDAYVHDNIVSTTDIRGISVRATAVAGTVSIARNVVAGATSIAVVVWAVGDAASDIQDALRVYDNTSSGSSTYGLYVDDLTLDAGCLLDVHGNLWPDAATQTRLPSSAISINRVGTVLQAVGAGTPEGAVAAPVGSTFYRTNGGAGTTLYVKESGTGNTGWVGK